VIFFLIEELNNMAKKFEKKLLSSAVALALGVGFSGSASAIHLSDDGKGQLLMAPIYMADYGYTSKVAIVNTRKDTAVKVRISLRSRKYSDEFDFMCLMTPSDVCRFEIVRAVNPVTKIEEAYLTSTDDSILASETRASFASECAGTNPGEFCKDGRLWVQVLDYDIRVTAANSPLDFNEVGHMEVLGAWAAQGTITHPAATDNSYPAGNVVIREAMSKADLYKIMGPKMSRSALALIPGQDEVPTYATGRVVGGVCVATPGLNQASDVEGSDNTMEYYGDICHVETSTPAAIVYPASRIRSTDPYWIQLTGQVEMENGTDRMGMRIPALAGDVWDNLTPAAHVPAYGMYSYSATGGVAFPYAFDGRVMSNPTYEAVFATELPVGDSFGASRAGVGAVGIYDNIVEIEHALSAQELQASYENKDGNLTNLIVTFPTKYRHDSMNNFYREGRDFDLTGIPSPVGRLSLGNDNDTKDVCASQLTLPGGHFLADARLYDGREFYPPFRPEGSIQYGLTVWDDQERRDTTVTGVPIFSPGVPGTVRTITDEVNYMWMMWPTKVGYGTGWFSLNLVPTTGCQYKGAAVLAFAHKTQMKNGAFANSWLDMLATEKDTGETILP